MKDGRPFQISHRYDLIRHGRFHKLIILDVEEEDAGEYSAVVKGSVTKAHLNVEGMEKLFSPFFHLLYFSYYVLYDISFACHSTATS